MPPHALKLAEPNVIDEDLIRKCITTVEEIKLSDEKKKELKMHTELHDIKALSFSFESILKIDNLIGLHSLVKLQLDNNTIENIENLEHLTNLEWLDLSFNNITKIEGLETLINLTDLSLFNNQIEELKGINTLTALNCLSIGNNNIKGLMTAVHYLRPFRNLRMINMLGNPCSKDPEYYPRIIALLSDIVYVDYRLVDPDKVTAAKEHYQDELFEIWEEEKKKAEADKNLQEELAFLQRLKDANIEGANTLLQSMLEDDPEQGKLSNYSFWMENIDDFQHQFKTLSQEFIETMLGDNGKVSKCSVDVKRQERERFAKVLADCRAKIDSDSKALVHKFEAKKKKLLGILNDFSETEAAAKLEELRAANTLLNEDLLELELRQKEQDDQIISSFEQIYNQLVATFIDTVQSDFCAKLRDIENDFFNKALQMAQEEHEKHAAGQLEDGVGGEEAARFLGDKEQGLGALSASHEAHIAIIDRWEAAVVGRERRLAAAMLEEARAGSVARDRRRVLEIVDITGKFNQEIVELIEFDRS